jgi:cytochrome oxidase Cu insertion factor (SCO1/SenC/PrrC family)
MNSSGMKYLLLLICLLGAAYASFVVWRWAKPRQPLGGVVAVIGPRASASHNLPPTSVGDFVLTDQDGRKFDSKSLRGKVWVASFFFTNCPAVCWRMNQALSAFQQTHPDSTARFVSITCDPDNDTPAALAKYAEYFKADPKRWTFLTGNINQIQSIGQDAFMISVVEKEHSDRACVVDRKGQVRGRFRLSEADQVQMLEKLIAVVEAEQPDEAHAAAEQPVGDETETDAPDGAAAAPVPASS